MKKATRIDACGLNYRQLNRKIRNSTGGELEIINLLGQRYLASGLRDDHRLHLWGTVGNNLAAFADGVEIEVFGNAQDGVANTMNSGWIAIYGNTGDIPGYALRGGQLWIRGNVGYRCGIHMKSYRHKQPTIIIGGRTGDFLGEYMAGGTVVVLNLEADILAPSTGTAAGLHTANGMHGGEIYLRGEPHAHSYSPEVEATAVDGHELLEGVEGLQACLEAFELDSRTLASDTFTRLAPKNSRPYGNLYAY